MSYPNIHEHINITDTDKQLENHMESKFKGIMTGEEEAALSYVPDRIAHEIRHFAALYGGMINEIRLRSRGILSVTIRGENIPCNSVVTEKECNDTILRLCQNSVYSFSDSIKEGYITTPECIRAGVCGRAVCENGTIISVCNISSINIRIPRRVIGAADKAFALLKEMRFQKGLLIWSPPGVGKTTLLRELIIRLGSGGNPFRVAVIDTRHELGFGIKDKGLIDVLDGYPRAKGIEIAKRTLSPEFIICDEIATYDDVSAIVDAIGSGIRIIASAHAGSLKDLLSQKYLKDVIDSDNFEIILGLIGQTFGGYEYDIFHKNHINNCTI